MIPFEECSHDEAVLEESGQMWCSDCRSNYSSEDGTLIYTDEYDEEPTEAQLEHLNNPDSGPNNYQSYRDSMRDAGRGHLLGSN